MPTLRELQTRVLGAVLDGEDAAELIRAGGLTPSSERLEVYANNARINFTEALATDTLERLTPGYDAQWS